MTGHVLLMILKIPVGCPSEIWVVKPLTWSDSKVLTWIEIFYQNKKFTTNINFARYFIPAIKEEVTWDPFQEWALTGAMPGLVTWRSKGCPSLPFRNFLHFVMAVWHKIVTKRLFKGIIFLHFRVFIDIFSSDLCLILSNIRAVQSASQSVKKNLPKVLKEGVGGQRRYEQC